MDKNRFETQKEVVNLDPTVHNIQSFFSVEDLKWLIEQTEKVEELSKFKKNAETLFQRQKLGFANSTEKIERLEKEIKEHCETKGLLGRQVYALSKLVDKQYEEIENLKQYKKVLMDNKLQEVINLLKSETKNLDDNEMLSFNVSFVKDIIESLEEQQKENEKLKGFIEYLQARNKDMVNINGWHIKTNKHLRERIADEKNEGKVIAELIYKWADKHHIHPDDFDSLFVPELLEKLEEDN